MQDVGVKQTSMLPLSKSGKHEMDTNEHHEQILVQKLM